MDNEKKNFKERWTSFARVVFDPWAVALYFLIGVLAIFYSQAKEDYVKALLTFLFSIIASLIGGIYTKRWSDINEEKILVARGTTAIRSLKLLLQQIVSVENRARLFFKRNEKKAEIELTKLNYEEIVDRCRLLEEQALGAIENWNDIIPEADVKTQIGILSELKLKEEELEKKIESVTEQKETSEKEKTFKEKEANSLKKELEKLRADLRDKEQKLNLSGLSGIASGSIGGGISGYSGIQQRFNFTVAQQNNGKCNKCGFEFYEPFQFPKTCPKCGSTDVHYIIRTG